MIVNDVFQPLNIFISLEGQNMENSKNEYTLLILRMNWWLLQKKKDTNYSLRLFDAVKFFKYV